MIDFLKRRLKSDKGAMDRVLVTLLFVVIGIAAVVGIESWSSSKKNDLFNKANEKYNTALK